MSVRTATVPALALAPWAPGAAEGAERFEAERMQIAPGRVMWCGTDPRVGATRCS